MWPADFQAHKYRQTHCSAQLVGVLGFKAVYPETGRGDKDRRQPRPVCDFLPAEPGLVLAAIIISVISIYFMAVLLIYINKHKGWLKTFPPLRAVRSRAGKQKPGPVPAIRPSRTAAGFAPARARHPSAGMSGLACAGQGWNAYISTS